MDLGFFTLHLRLLIRDLYVIFSPFEDVMSHSKVRINDMITLVFLLEHCMV